MGASGEEARTHAEATGGVNEPAGPLPRLGRYDLRQADGPNELGLTVSGEALAARRLAVPHDR